MLTQEQITSIHRSVWQQGYGSISDLEAGFLQAMIHARKPRSFLEVGTASGLSTGFIAQFMSECGGGELVSIDLDETFWVDRSQPTGFLAGQIYRGEGVDIAFHRGQDSTFLQQAYRDRKFDAVFIDANHQHPWPTLDMLAVLPFVNAGACVAHHDLALYRRQTPVFGIGPKFLFDQVDARLRVVIADRVQNIFYIKVEGDYREFAGALLNALYIPWTIRAPIPQSRIDHFRNIIETYWDERLLGAFDQTVGKFNARRAPASPD